MNITNETAERKPITITPERLAANRCNAQKSTGPRTARGKAVVSRNARKHNLLARTVVVRGLQLRESRKAFSNLCREFYAQFMPVGVMEEMLVDQVASVTWRLRRARLAESGEIGLSVDTGWWRRQDQQSLSLLLEENLRPGLDGAITRLQRSAKGCDYILASFRKLRQSVARQGELTEEAVSAFNNAFKGAAYGLVGKMNKFCDSLSANPEMLDPETLRARHREVVMKFLDLEITKLQHLVNQCEEREEIEEQSWQSAAVLPSPEVLDKILRYEASLNRQLYQALNQLDRLQQRRNGNAVPAPLTVETSAKTENCETNPFQNRQNLQC